MARADVHARAIAWGGAAIVLAVAVAVLAVFALLRHWDMPAGTDRARLPYPSAFAGPALQSAPQVELARYRAEKRALLESSAWVDAAHGVVRIPIASAIEVMVERAAASNGPQEQRR